MTQDTLKEIKSKIWDLRAKNQRIALAHLDRSKEPNLNAEDERKCYAARMNCDQLFSELLDFIDQIEG